MRYHTFPASPRPLLPSPYFLSLTSTLYFTTSPPTLHPPLLLISPTLSIFPPHSPFPQLSTTYFSQTRPHSPPSLFTSRTPPQVPLLPLLFSSTQPAFPLLTSSPHRSTFHSHPHLSSTSPAFSSHIQSLHPTSPILHPHSPPFPPHSCCPTFSHLPLHTQLHLTFTPFLFSLTFPFHTTLLTHIHAPLLQTLPTLHSPPTHFSSFPTYTPLLHNLPPFP